MMEVLQFSPVFCVALRLFAISRRIAAYESRHSQGFAWLCVLFRANLPKTFPGIEGSVIAAISLSGDGQGGPSGTPIGPRPRLHQALEVLTNEVRITHRRA
jgi:hypothetical protein